MLRFAASATVNFTWAMCSGDRYFPSPGDLRPGDMLKMKIPLADNRSRSRKIFARPTGGSAPFQLWNGWIAPYSCGGALKFAATSATEGTVICCQGRCASDIAHRSGRRENRSADFIGRLRFAEIGSPELYPCFPVRRVLSAGSGGPGSALRSE